MIPELLEKAARSADAAELLLRQGAADDAVSRAYYALFNTARALIYDRNPNFEGRSHGAVLAEFSRLLVKTGELPQDWGAALNRAQVARHVADYGDVPVPLEEAADYVRQARELLSFARQTIRPSSPGLSR